MKIATALPDQQEIPSGRGTALLGDIVSEDFPRKRAYIKLQSIGDIAREALCAVLARYLQLPVQQPFYVSMQHTEYARRGNIEGIAFGLLHEPMPSSRIVDIQGIEDQLLRWPNLLKAAVFDEWIANSKRIPNNLIYELGEYFWLCDHEEAFPDYVGPATPVNSQLLALAAEGKSEFELFKLRNDAMHIVAEFENVDWNTIYALLNGHVLKSAKNFFEKHIQFLKERLPELRTLISQGLHIKQSEFPFIHSENSRTEVRHEK